MSSVPSTLLSGAGSSVAGRTKHAPKRVPKTGRTATTVGSRRKSSKPKAAVCRTSENLREIISDISDESQQVLAVEQIVKALGQVFAAAVRAILIELLPEEHVIRRDFVEGAEAALDARQKAKASKEVTIPKKAPAKHSNAKTKLEREPRPGQSGAPQPDKSRSVRFEAPSFDSGPFSLISREEDRSGQKAVAPVIERLKAWREASSLSQSQAVKLLNAAGLPVKVRTLQGWEIGRQPQAITAAGLQRFLDQQFNHRSTPA